MSERIHIGIVVGEASGDILGAALMVELRKIFPDAEFSGIGGPKMLALGFHSFFPQDRLAVMGFVEPLKRLPELLRIRKFLRNHFIHNKPHVFIGIDSPDFNLSLEESLKKYGVKTVHYVSPSVWAWRQSRIKKIAHAVDLMLALFPFEAAFYQKHNVPVEFVGHHLADEIPETIDKYEARRALGIPEHARVIALLPGSRHSEVERLGEVFMKSAVFCLEQDPGLLFYIPAANSDRYRELHLQLNEFVDFPLQLFNGRSHQVMAAADVLLLASGTVTLEAMLLKKPMVVAYKMSALSYWIISRLLKVPFISLPNLIANKMLVPEFIQSDAKPDRLSRALMHYFENPEEAQALTVRFGEMHRELKRNASERAAKAVAQLIRG